MSVTIAKENVLSVYSGRPGCCCGCLGKHAYRKDPKLRALAGQKRGHEIGDDEVNEEQVTRVLNILKANPERVRDEGDHFFLDTGSRWYIVRMT